MRRSGEGMVPDIRLEEKRVRVPTPMVAEPFFLVPVAVTPIVQCNVVIEAIVESLVPMAAMPISFSDGRY
jgi:hypothetical protein